ncbi:MAG: PSD1 domain-containing protein [Planctomycetaceae bacterium]|nr:PSD1 domain-containing protein [Planctomycetales bacterium]MCB9926957.1 PSD1 domain-containing protein [Planctomycetaceae bacterium]
MRSASTIAIAFVFLKFSSLMADDAKSLPPAVERQVDFVADVQPILRKTCYSCHGAEEQEAGLRLDVKARALEGGDGGKSIVPGDSAKSRLITLVAGLDEDTGIMPPEGEGTPLTPEQIALLRAWIDQGANWPEDADVAAAESTHWSFQPIANPTPPTPKEIKWVKNPIDAFILNRLEAKGIRPSEEASRETLLRRVYLDLLGLPPSPLELDSYLRDSRPDAYDRMVERVLASPHYGERWGRHWLDLARYADSDGYEKDRARPHAWRYRNWVIDALNADLSYEQFSIEQIAGDMLSEATLDQKVASGFHRNTLHNTEGGTDQEEDRVKKTVDRTNTVGAIWLGLTVGCAQCHSHKYDPLTQREYYQLYAFFNDINETDIDAPLPMDQERFRLAKAAHDAEHAKLTAAVNDYETNQLAKAQAAWEAVVVKDAVVWQTIEPTSVTSKHGATLQPQGDGSWLATGKNEVSDVYTVETNIREQRVTAIRLEVLPDKSLVKDGPGRADNGNFVLTTFSLLASSSNGDETPTPVELANAKADFSQNDWQVEKAVNDDPVDGWAVSPEVGKRHVAVFELKEAIQSAAGVKLTFLLDQTYNRGNSHNIGRFRLSYSSGQLPAPLEGLPADIASALAKRSEERTDDQVKRIAKYFRSVDPELARLNQIVTDHAKQAPASSGVKAQTVVQVSEPRQAKIHIRGDFLNPGEPVVALTPAVLPGMEVDEVKYGRLDFARWLFAEDNPLTARVTVNRTWQRIFGRGIVNSVDDFGTQGETPSHPELLDWLASEFRRQGWSLKQLHRLIVNSSTYRQSSAFRSELVEIDPENILLARQQRRRVEAETIRDLALAASGLLDSRLGGPSVRPPQPAEYSSLTYANSAKWQVSKGGDAYRRGLYTFFQRTSPYPMLMTFDSPDSTECCAQRSLSNTPLQALTLWNDPAFYECAQALGSRVVAEVPPVGDSLATTRQRAKYAFALCLSRFPSEEELLDVIRLFEDQRSRLSNDSEAAKLIIGKQVLTEQTAPAELAAWIIVGRTLINLDEFITRE